MRNSFLQIGGARGSMGVNKYSSDLGGTGEARDGETQFSSGSRVKSNFLHTLNPLVRMHYIEWLRYSSILKARKRSSL